MVTDFQHQQTNNINAKILPIKALVTEWKVILLMEITFLKFMTKIAELKASITENPRPVLLEFKTFRMRGHEEASGTKYVPQELWTMWAKKDPIDKL
jgi:TPP-dependent pyruvate/acetoin dehydrogenase alpha subunit